MSYPKMLRIIRLEVVFLVILLVSILTGRYYLTHCVAESAETLRTEAHSEVPRETLAGLECLLSATH